jgi:hypothetical protein
VKIGYLIALGGVAAAGAGGYLYAKHAYDHLFFDFEGVHLNKINEGVLNVSIKYVIRNETSLSFTIKSTDLNLFINNDFVGVARLKQPLVVPAMTSMIMDVDTDFDATKLGQFGVNYLLKLVGGGKLDITTIIQGSCSVQLNVPVLSLITINIPVSETTKM